MAIATILGYPRIGKFRELKVALESYWKNQSSEADLKKTAAALRAENWQLQKSCGISAIPSNDFSFYDTMLDNSALFGVVPERYHAPKGNVSLATYFAMARGSQHGAVDVPAAEMTKWFDTNYHYIVPEFSSATQFTVSTTKAVDEFNEAKALGITTRPVLTGIITYLLLGKKQDGGNNLALLDQLLPVYIDVLKQLEHAGAEWVQLDEPALVLDLDAEAKAAYAAAYAKIRAATSLKLFVATYFGGLRDNLDVAVKLPINALHVDLVRAPEQLDEVLAKLPASITLSFGIVDGRNIWRNDLDASLAVLEKAAAALGNDRVWVSASCSLLHTPYDLDAETALDAELKGWLAFAKQKLQEIATLTQGLNEGRGAITAALEASNTAVNARKNSGRIHNPAVKEALTRQPLTVAGRKHSFAERRKLQQEKYQLPLYPTTTIGSFPQTAELRQKRAAAKSGALSAADYDAFLKEQTKATILFQEEIGIDVLVHGEFERNDMVEYFGEQLSGFAFTKNGWVQSYGSRCVKPPIIFGDVSRPHPMTVYWSHYAQTLTKKPVKGMLTGPVTILQWSFVRNDQPRSVTTHQIALALQQEVLDLEKAGINIIQIDEPAYREGLPLRRADWQAYLIWASQAFRLSYTGVQDQTQIHTHMCYSEFNDIIDSIRALDADVISIETSRSQMELLDAFIDYKYPNEIGPGVYDIHSPRVPSEVEMTELLAKASERLDESLLWVNPDCGLKTRDWPETKSALTKMVSAAKAMREISAKRKAA